MGGFRSGCGGASVARSGVAPVRRRTFRAPPALRDRRALARRDGVLVVASSSSKKERPRTGVATVRPVSMPTACCCLRNR